mgnify:CR=1 FL=1
MNQADDLMQHSMFELYLIDDEQVVMVSDQVFRWEGPKRKQTIIKAKLGRVVLTDRRLLFLSTGSNDLSAGKLVAGGVSRGSLGLGSSATDHLDLSALDTPGKNRLSPHATICLPMRRSSRVFSPRFQSPLT